MGNLERRVHLHVTKYQEGGGCEEASSSMTTPEKAPAGVVAGSTAGGPELVHRHIFGLKSDVKNNFFWLDDNKILYPAGHTIVIYDIEQKVQQFIFGR